MLLDELTRALDAAPTCPTEPLRGDGVIVGGVRRLHEASGLPRGFDAPSVPALAVVFAQVGAARAGGVLTRVARHGHEGWLPLVVRTEDPRVAPAVRDHGIEAALAELAVERSGDGWRAQATRFGRPTEVLDELAWAPEDPEDTELVPLAERLVAFRDPLLLPSGRVDIGLLAPGGVAPRLGRATGAAAGPGALVEGRLQLTFSVSRSSSVALMHARACHARRAAVAGRRVARRRR